MNKIIAVLVSILLLAGIPAGAQSPTFGRYFKHFSSHEGLSSNAVTCCQQDHFGLLWVGTKDGVCRFDGYQFLPLIPSGRYGWTLEGMVLSLCETADGKLWYSTVNGTGWFDLETGEIQSTDELSALSFYDIDTDRFGDLWLCSTSQILYRFFPEEGRLVRYDPFEHFHATKAENDSQGHVWFSSQEGDIYTYNASGDRFQRVSARAGRNEFPRLGLRDIYNLEGDTFLVATDGFGIRKVNAATGRVETLVPEGSLPGVTSITSLLANVSDEYWIATNAGLFIYYYGQDRLEHFRHDPRDVNSLAGDNISGMIKDRDGNIWICTFYNGLDLLLRRRDDIRTYFQNPYRNTIKGTAIKAVAQDRDGQVWLGSEDGGLNVFRLGGRRNTVVEGLLPDDVNIQQILPEGDSLWIATFNRGLFLVDRVRRRVVRHFGFSEDFGRSGLFSDNITCIRPEESGQVYVGTAHGLYLYSRETDRFQFVDTIGDTMVYSILDDGKGHLLVGTYGSGLWTWDLEQQVFQQYLRGGEGCIASNYILYLYMDSRQRIWGATDGGGLFRIDDSDPQQYVFTAFRRESGFPSNTLSSIVEDEDGILWVGTTSGLVEFDPQAGQVRRTHAMNESFIGDYYLGGSCTMTEEGFIFMGTTDGLLGFIPSMLRRNLDHLSISLVDVSATDYDGQTSQVTEPGHSVYTSRSIRLREKEASLLRITVSAPALHNQRSVQYEYSLQKRRGKLLQLRTRENSISFTELDPGWYTFTAAVGGVEDGGDSVSLAIRIVPPFYRSVWAYAAYALLLLVAAYVTTVLYRRKKQDELDQKIELLEMGTKQEVANAKINFFTNIAHEVRTPLTLIKLPLDKMIEAQDYTEAQAEDLFTMQSNVNRLMGLINQLLDIRKAEQGQMRLNFVREDLGRIISHTLELFRQAAQEQGIRIRTDLPEKHISAMCARDAVEHILSNLISNAFKYGRDEIGVSLSLDAGGEKALIRVDSNGQHISEKEAEKIFEAFYQIPDVSARIKENAGTGLGLPFARSLASMHGGRLYLDTAVADVNSFVLELPLFQPEDSSMEPLLDRTESEPVQNLEEPDGSKLVLLLVEDESGLRQYMASQLADEYAILQASNGQEALNVIREYRVDLIISDILMPVMDGCELCNTIKNDIEFSHIPIILLTAAAGLDTHLKTLDSGADGYLEKPFEMSLLRANIKNLFKNREIVFKQFTDSPLTHLKSVSMNKVENDFMVRVHNIILENIADPNLSIDSLCKTLNTSKSTLYRKIKADTGMNANEYIRLCRLKKAAEMLSNSSSRVNEVAYLVGFSSLSYFTAIFKKQFNVSPSAFMREQKEKKKVG